MAAAMFMSLSLHIFLVPSSLLMSMAIVVSVSMMMMGLVLVPVSSFVSHPARHSTTKRNDHRPGIELREHFQHSSDISGLLTYKA